MSGTTNVPSICVVVRDGSKTLLILREHTGWKDGEYVVPSGHVEANETFKQAAVRETLEEVGLQVKPEDLKYLLTVHRQSPSSTRIDVYFETIKWSGTARNMEPKIHAEVKWFDIANLPDNVADYIKFGLDNIRAGNTYAEFGWGS